MAAVLAIAHVLATAAGVDAPAAGLPGSDLFSPAAVSDGFQQGDGDDHIRSHATLAALVLTAAGVLLLWLLAACAYTTLWRPYRLIRRCSAQGIPFLPFRPLVGQIPEMRAAWHEQIMGTGVNERGMAIESADSLSPFLWKSACKHGNVFGICFGYHPRLIIADASMARQVLVSNAGAYDKSPLTRKNLPLLGNGLVLSGGEFWARQRRMINPAFHLSSIQGMIATMDQVALAAVARWSSRARQQLATASQGAGGTSGSGSSNSCAVEVEMHEEMAGVALEVVGRAAFGAKVAGGGREGAVKGGGGGGSGLEGDGGEGGGGGGSIDASMIYNAVNETIAMRMKMFVSGRLVIPFYTWLPTSENRALHRAEASIREVTKDLIKHRRAALQRGEPPGNDLLASMLAARDDETNERMDDQQLMDECLTFLLAGHETTSQLLTWTLYLLARHPEWQDKLREEVAAALEGESSPQTTEDPKATGAGEAKATDDRPVLSGDEWEGKDTSGSRPASPSCATGDDRDVLTWAVLSRLHNMTMVLQECLRMYPPVPLVARYCIKENKVGHFTMPPGLDINIPIALLHHDAELWGDDVNLFRPQRFKDGVASACKNPTAYLPFSLGPRNCIGSVFAMTEVKVVLVRLLQSLSWSLSPGYRHHPLNQITLRPKYGMPLLLTPLRP